MSRTSLQRSVGSRALEWLAAEFPRFDVFERLTAGHPCEASQTAVCDLALTLLVLGRDDRLRRDERIRRLADHLIRTYRNPAFHTYLFDGHPQALTGHVIAWLAVDAFGGLLPISRERLQERVDADPLLSDGREAFRTIELRYFLEWGSFSHPLPDAAHLFQQTWLARSAPPPARVTVQDAYEATHTVVYATDFGRTLPPFLGDAPGGRIRDLFLECLEALVRMRHWDLVAEVLLALECFRVSSLDAVERAWRALGDAQGPGGAIPEDPSTEGPSLRRPGSTRPDFLALYHRCLMAVLAAFVERGGEPARPPAGV